MTNHLSETTANPDGLHADYRGPLTPEELSRLRGLSAPDPLDWPRARGLAFTAVAGVDPSMTNTGVAVWHRPFPSTPEATDLGRVQTKPVQSGTDAKGKPAATWADRHNRLALITAQVTARVPSGALVFMEAPSYGSVGAGTFDRSGLWWRVFAALVDHGCRVVPVSPSQRMLYATGKGGGKDAGKDAVIAAVTRRYPWLDVTDNNVADAVVLMAMGRRAAGFPAELVGTLPAANLKALEKLESI